MNLTPRETATLVAALRMWQHIALPSCAYMQNHIATHDDEFTPLDEGEVTALIAKVEAPHGGPPTSEGMRTILEARRATLDDLTDRFVL